MFLFLFVAGCLAADVSLNINIRFSTEIENEYIAYANELVKNSSVANQIDFTKCAPHATLYLTDFPEEYIPVVSQRYAYLLQYLED